MEERANAYQLMRWDALRTEGVALPEFANLRVEVLQHTEPDGGVYKDLRAASSPDRGVLGAPVGGEEGSP